jgi:branched-chain amino acid transport system permease protein
MRENREAASSLGLNIAELRFGAFVLSAAYGGAAGALMAHVIHVVSPENLDLALMVTCLTMTVIGGRTRIAGAILGAILIVYLREWFRVLENYYMIAYGTAALAALILAPYGLVGALERCGSFCSEAAAPRCRPRQRPLILRTTRLTYCRARC